VALANALGVTVDYLVGSEAAVTPELLEHRVLMYGSDEEYLGSVIPFLVDGITQSDCVLAVTATRQVGLLRDALGDDAVHVEFRDSAHWYHSPTRALDDYRAFVKDRFASGAPWVRIIGEPVWSGRTEAEIAAWTCYESMINLSFASSPATIVCPYDTRSVSEAVLADASHTHPEVAGMSHPSANPAYRRPEDFLLG
jgi:hypothetical protein